MDQPYAYQSPIALDKKESIRICQTLDVCGNNDGAVYDASSHIFIIQDPIYLTLRSEKYKLIEYHFHVPGEHVVENKTYMSEIHYVFMNCDSYNDQTKETNCIDVCGCCNTTNSDILVIGRVIRNDNSIHYDLNKLNIRVPYKYFEYDGTLTTGTYSPVRWLIGIHAIELCVNDIIPIAKTARSLQSFDGRIKLFCCNSK